MNIDQWTEKCKEKMQTYQNDLVVIENTINKLNDEISSTLQRRIEVQAIIRNMSQLIKDLEDEKSLTKSK
jgi:hypothetical protein